MTNARVRRGRLTPFSSRAITAEVSAGAARARRPGSWRPGTGERLEAHHIAQGREVGADVGDLRELLVAPDETRGAGVGEDVAGLIGRARVVHSGTGRDRRRAREVSQRPLRKVRRRKIGWTDRSRRQSQVDRRAARRRTSAASSPYDRTVQASLRPRESRAGVRGGPMIRRT